MADLKISSFGGLTTVAGDDEMVIVDKSDTTQAATGTTKKVQVQEAIQDVTHGATEKTTPVDADEVGLVDSAASNVLKRLTWANIKATLKAYFDTLYCPSSDGWISAGETWTYASADDPTFTFTISGDKTTKYQAGQRIKLTQTTDKYFIITKVSYSDPNTTITVYGGTDYDLANAAITSPYYSREKAPFGFPLDPTKWTVEVTDSTSRTQSSPTQFTWYNLGSISITVPIGLWVLGYYVQVKANEDSENCDIYTTLSTANNSESNSKLTTRTVNYNAASGGTTLSILTATATRQDVVNLSSETTYYLNAKTDVTGQSTIEFSNDKVPLLIRAVCSYL